jgi:hypothetical protein
MTGFQVYRRLDGIVFPHRYAFRSPDLQKQLPPGRLTLNAIWFSERFSWIVSDIKQVYIEKGKL